MIILSKKETNLKKNGFSYYPKLLSKTEINRFFESTLDLLNFYNDEKKGFINFMIHFYRKHLFPQPFLKDKQQDILFFQNEFLMVFQKQLKRLMQN